MKRPSIISNFRKHDFWHTWLGVEVWYPVETVEEGMLAGEGAVAPFCA